MKVKNNWASYVGLKCYINFIYAGTSGDTYPTSQVEGGACGKAAAFKNPTTTPDDLNAAINAAAGCKPINVNGKYTFHFTVYVHTHKVTRLRNGYLPKKCQNEILLLVGFFQHSCSLQFKNNGMSLMPVTNLEAYV